MNTEFEYMNRISEILEEVYETNKDTIKMLAEKFAENIMADKLIHTFGTGHSHMLGIELFARAGGLGNVDAMLDPDTLTAYGAVRSSLLEKTSGISDIIYDGHKIEKGDIMIITSNSGRNSMPIEMAMRCRKEGIYVVAITSLKQSSAMTSRHPSGKRLFELADCVLDNCTPSGDGCLNINGYVTGAVSSIASMFLVNTITSEALKIVTAKGFKPYVFQSQNVDGFDNDAIYRHFEGRIKHF
ncbi:MAG: SIS domain-containing protein [Erysipelotrichaceae bacterium]|nr:SIS domain-containing protein [Erysipelotrichaceae bacterium]MBR5049627.1 SIS domain-containing protein [Erysipelotrichaceae bacterium]